MGRNKTHLAEVPIAFRVEQEIHDFLTEEMIQRKVFNKSLITREIFMKGLELLKAERGEK